MEEEFCIMDDNPPRWSNHRQPGLVRHEIFFGRKNRQKSIEDGLVVFLTPFNHNQSNYGVHFNQSFNEELKKLGEQKWMEYYGKTKEEFRERYGRNYL